MSLESILSLLWSKLASTSSYAAIIPIVLGGGLAFFKPLIPTEDDIRTRTNARIDALRENINGQIHGLLTKAVFSLDPTKLRGDVTAIPPEPDVVGDCLSEVFRITRILPRLESIRKRNSFVHTYISYTIAFGILSFLFTNLVESSRPYVALLCYMVIISQICAAGLIRRCKNQLEIYEKSA
jgi:hypothetical protein